MDPILGFIGKLLSGGLVAAFTTWRRNRGEAARVQFQDYFNSLEKQIDAAEKRGDKTEVTRLRRQYEEEQEGWRAQQNLEFSASREVGQDASVLTAEELEKIRLLLVGAQNAPAAMITAEGHFLRGNAYFASGDHDEAISEYTQAIRLNSKYADAYIGRGNAYLHKGEHDRALEEYTEAIRLIPNTAGAYYNRGIAYRGKGEHDRAIAEYTEAIRLNPECAQAY